MRRRFFFGAAGVAIFLVGLVAGILSVNGFTASAQAGATQRQASAGPGQYCQLYEQTLANELGVKAAKLEQANADALTAVLNQLATDGKITAFEKTALQQQLDQFRSDPCAALTKLAQGQGTQAAAGGLKAMASMARGSLAAAVAPKLGLTSQALTSELSQGKTVAQIAQAKGADLAAAQTAYLNAASSLLSQAVAGGFITQEQSDLASKALARAVAQGHFPLLDGGAKSAANG